MSNFYYAGGVEPKEVSMDRKLGFFNNEGPNMRDRAIRLAAERSKKYTTGTVK